jgi:hypothetical protein
MPPLNEGPFGTYVDATGVVNATAAAEIVVLGATLKTYVKSTFAEGVTSGESVALSPEFDKLTRDLAERLVGEIDGVLAAIAAAPTA